MITLTCKKFLKFNLKKVFLFVILFSGTWGLNSSVPGEGVRAKAPSCSHAGLYIFCGGIFAKKF